MARAAKAQAPLAFLRVNRVDEGLARTAGEALATIAGAAAIEPELELDERNLITAVRGSKSDVAPRVPRVRVPFSPRRISADDS